MRIFILSMAIILGFISINSCNSVEKIHIRKGIWRGQLDISENLTLPFNFEITNQDGRANMIIYNADERIRLDEISIKNDTILIHFPVYNSHFELQLEGDSILKGFWVNKAKSDDYKLAFIGEFGETGRFNMPKGEQLDFSGNFQIDFNPGGNKPSPAIGRFQQTEHVISGTFLTPTGDYRFLEGNVYRNKLFLSAFDGAHAFYFSGEMIDDTIRGEFRSGNHYKTEWIGFRNDSFALPNPESLTYLNPGFKKLSFEFPNLDNKTVSLADTQFQNKALIVQIMGSWCPNCKDESVFLSSFYENKPEDVEVIALAFEIDPVFEKASPILRRMKKQLGINYEILIAGGSRKSEAAKALPMLNTIISYPTTIFLNKNHDVVSIHTGFNGPATGDKYEEFKKRFKDLINQIRREG